MKLRSVSLCFVFPILLASAFRAVGQDFGADGYFLALPAWQVLDEKVAREFASSRNILSEGMRLRFRPNVHFGSGLSFSAEYEINETAASSSMVSGFRTDLGHRQITPLRWVVASRSCARVEHFIDRLSIRWNTDQGSVVVGRQRISWGTGRIWNPTDLFNPINPADYGKIEKDGVDALSAKANFGSFTDLQFVVNAGEHGRNINAGGRFRTNTSGFDFSILGGSFDRRTVVGGDIAGSVFEAGIRAEAMAVIRNPSGVRFVKWIAGADYQFSPEFYALVEYHFNGEGADDPSSYDFSRLVTGRIINLGRAYAAVAATYMLHPLVSLAFAATGNLGDASAFTHLSATWSAHEDLQVTGGIMYTFGKPGGEYTLYPKALYVRGEWYF
ncbi:MAG: hypothetical protein QHI48_08355 [Bacteroidota bacterium]|nr:hypothetical protein [Bacteroidota bacterium]